MEKEVKLDLSNVDDLIPGTYNGEQRAQAKTLFFKKLSLALHKFYHGKIQVLPRAGMYSFNWLNVYYTPGISNISTTIRDNNDASFDITSRGNSVAIVSDSTRVLGDKDCTPPGGMGVMEGKAFIMKLFGGIDAVPVCIDSRNKKGEHDPDKIIDFVKMVQPSFGAINLEDISQPNCYKVLDTLTEQCDIPVWHDDAQGTACVTLAAVINSLKLTNRKIKDTKFVLLGAGVSNTSIARFLMLDGADPKNISLFDSKGGLHTGRTDIKEDKRFYRKWELCEQTNPNKFNKVQEALKGADVLIALSTPGPDVVKREWIKSMNEKSIVFACANPIPEIYPSTAKEAGAYIVGSGRADFPNMINNSICFPALLKGVLIVRSKKITDKVAITCAHSLADRAEKRGIKPDNILLTMEETEEVAQVATDVAMACIEEGLAHVPRKREEILKYASDDIHESQKLVKLAIDNKIIPIPPQKLINDAFNGALEESRSQIKSPKM